MIISKAPQDNYLYNKDKYLTQNDIKKIMMKKEMHRMMEDEIILFYILETFVRSRSIHIKLQ